MSVKSCLELIEAKLKGANREIEHHNWHGVAGATLASAILRKKLLEEMKKELEKSD